MNKGYWIIVSDFDIALEAGKFHSEVRKSWA